MAIIKELRERQGMTQDDLAKAVGVSQQAVQQWESGRSSPRGKNLRAVCDVLNISPGRLQIEQLIPDTGVPDIQHFRRDARKLLQTRFGDKVNVAVQAGATKWTLDYLDDIAVILCPLYLQDDSQITGALWRLIVLKASFPQYRPVLILVGTPPFDNPTHQVKLQRLMAEATILNIGVYMVERTDQIAALIETLEAD